MRDPEGLSLKSGPFLIYHPTKKLINQFWQSFWILTLLKVCNETIKNSKHHPVKINRLHKEIIKIMKEPETSFQSSQ